MDDFDAGAIIESWLQRLPPVRVHVGYSGGLDSSVLLHALATAAAAYGRDVLAIHIDHGLHPHSAQWAEHCRSMAATWALPIEVLRVTVAFDQGLGLEAAARRARYAGFRSLIEPGGLLALAQHRDDQAETVLLRLLRGSGAEGLAAMRPARLLHELDVRRPLLGTSRATLLAYAQTHRLRWLEDPSNADTGLDRNFIRHQVLPVLETRWPQASDALATSAALLAEAAETVAEVAASDLADAQGLDPDTLRRDRLRRLPARRQREALRCWLQLVKAPPMPAAVLQQLPRLLNADAPAETALSWRSYRLRIHRELLLLERVVSLPRDWQCDWDGAAPIDLPPPHGQLAIEPAVADPALRLSVAARRGGERMRLPGRTHRHSVKHLLQDLGVPRAVRERLPIVTSAQGEVWAVGDLIIAAELQDWLATHQAALRWRCGV